MLLLSAKARRLINTAVGDLPDPEQRNAWMSWASANPDIRSSAGLADDRGGPIPTGVAAVALAALARKVVRLEERRGTPLLSEDEMSDIENDLTFIDTVEAALIQNLREASAQKAA